MSTIERQVFEKKLFEGRKFFTTKKWHFLGGFIVRISADSQKSFNLQGVCRVGAQRHTESRMRFRRPKGLVEDLWSRIPDFGIFCMTGWAMMLLKI